jgi:lipoate-protein ligase A
MTTSYALGTWRLLITPPAAGAANMALDESILQSLADGVGHPTLRFYQWDPPCLSLGYNQPWTDIDESACARLGYDWVRRPTGGRAILHCDELTYSVVVSASEPRVAGGIVESYRRLSRGLLNGLRILGAEVFQTQEKETVNLQQGAACFDTPSNYEITVGGKKLIGSAQMRRRGQVLQHGSLPLVGDLDGIFGCLGVSGDESRTSPPRAQRSSLRPYACTLEQALERSVSFDEAAAALAQGFGDALNLRLEPGELTEHECVLTDHLYQTRYGNEEWNRRV